jgi:hypothetical protein
VKVIPAGRVAIIWLEGIQQPKNWPAKPVRSEISRAGFPLPDQFALARLPQMEQAKTQA